MTGLLARVAARLRWRRAAPPAPDLRDDGTLTVLVGAWDPARADTAVVADLAASGAALDGPLLVRHHLELPDELAVEEARRLLAQDGYALRAAATAADGPGEGGGADAGAPPGPPGAGLRVRASRAQLVTGLSLAQERSRMAGLAQRLGGDALGYDVLGPAQAAAGTG